MRRVMLGTALVLALAAPAFAADKQTLADIRAELAQVSAQLQELRSELVASGASGLQAAGGASALQRMDTMEAELTRLTAMTEQLKDRVDKVVKDGTNRVGDLEFRVCELEEGCDPSSVGQAQPLGGAAPAAAAAAPAASGGAASTGGTMAMNEQADFDRAKGVLDQGDFRAAADLFKTFAETYPGGPLTGDAGYLRGEALMKAGDVPGAARAWLDGFSAEPEGKRAADDLLELGKALGTLGQKTEACATLTEVPARFPGSEAAGKVAAAQASLGCP
ncbi:tol-pal system protein YbgF [Rhodobacter capsulatus]|uniref:tol-pal system protein YbgF n=1 Tax=Rhodobacter capsulatus TaxID=1061 RepID=UPI0003D37256|nr:tol-pal system protein YbgF [Rhodobacter capsulatus]ETD00450.1 tol-pal system protein YbgF [Rhodobacter capsulatus DE442]ETD74790.1 tol-pal system protein YbgF [Rhodobacter capsulatus R121]ETE52356.1 tol-pal system protein YbgF [Rhodobacter capsulatus Y262]MDS0928718.1 tol-pal system protein YbgF [Rhodobacter capsulatus]